MVDHCLVQTDLPRPGQMTEAAAAVAAAAAAAVTHTQMPRYAVGWHDCAADQQQLAVHVWQSHLPSQASSYAVNGERYLPNEDLREVQEAGEALCLYGMTVLLHARHLHTLVVQSDHGQNAGSGLWCPVVVLSVSILMSSQCVKLLDVALQLQTHDMLDHL